MALIPLDTLEPEAGFGDIPDKEPRSKVWRRPLEDDLSFFGDSGDERPSYDMIKYGSQVPGDTARLAGEDAKVADGKIYGDRDPDVVAMESLGLYEKAVGDRRTAMGRAMDKARFAVLNNTPYEDGIWEVLKDVDQDDANLIWKMAYDKWHGDTDIYLAASKYTKEENINENLSKIFRSDKGKQQRFLDYVNEHANPQERTLLEQLGRSAWRGVERTYRNLIGSGVAGDENEARGITGEAPLPTREEYYSKQAYYDRLKFARDVEKKADIEGKISGGTKPGTVGRSAAVQELEEFYLKDIEPTAGGRGDLRDPRYSGERVDRLDFESRAIAAREAGDPIVTEHEGLKGLVHQGAIDVAGMAPPMAMSMALTKGAGALTKGAGSLASMAFWVTQIKPGLRRDLVDAGMSVENADQWATIAAIPSAMLEHMQVKALTPKHYAAINKKVMPWLLNQAINYLKTTGQELTEEGLQFLTEEGFKRGALALNELEPEENWAELSERFSEEMKRSGVALAMMGVGTHGSGAALQLAKDVDFKQKLSEANTRMLYDMAHMVSVQSAKDKMVQYAATIKTKMEAGEPLTKVAGLAKKVLKEAQGILQKKGLQGTPAEEVVEGEVAPEVAADAPAKSVAEGILEKAQGVVAPAVEKEAVAEVKEPAAKPEKVEATPVAPPKKLTKAQQVAEARAKLKAAEQAEVEEKVAEIEAERKGDPMFIATSLDLRRKVSDALNKKKISAKKFEAIGEQVLQGVFEDMTEADAAEAADKFIGIAEQRNAEGLLSDEDLAYYNQALAPTEPEVKPIPEPVARPVKAAVAATRAALEDERDSISRKLARGTITKAEASALSDKLLERATEYEDVKKKDLTSFKKSVQKIASKVTKVKVSDAKKRETIKVKAEGRKTKDLTPAVKKELAIQQVRVLADLKRTHRDLARKGLEEGETKKTKKQISRAADSAVNIGAFLKRHFPGEGDAEGLAHPEKLYFDAIDSGDYAGAAALMDKVAAKLQKSYGLKNKARRAYGVAVAKQLTEIADTLRIYDTGEIPQSLFDKQDALEESIIKRQEAVEAAQNNRSFAQYVSDTKGADSVDITKEPGKGALTSVGPLLTQGDMAKKLKKQHDQKMEEAKIDRMAAKEKRVNLIVESILVAERDLPSDQRKRWRDNLLRDLPASEMDAVNDILNARKPDRAALEEMQDVESERADIDQAPSYLYSGLGLPPNFFDSFENLLLTTFKGGALYKLAPETHEELRVALGSKGFEQKEAIRIMEKAFKGLIKSEAEDDFLNRHRQQQFKYPIPEGKDHDRLVKAAKLQDAIYKEFQEKMLDTGVLKGTWPKSEIDRIYTEVKELEEKVGHLESPKAIKTTQKEIADLNLKARVLSEMANSGALRYGRNLVNFSAKFKLAKLAATRGSLEKLNSTPDRFLGRKYNTIDELEAAMTEIDPEGEVVTSARTIMADMISYGVYKMKVHQVNQKIAENEFLVMPKGKAPKDWVTLSLPEYKGKKVIPALAAAIYDFTASAPTSSKIFQLYDKVNIIGKLLKFWNPIVMGVNNLFQGTAAGGLPFYKNMPAAAKHVFGNSDLFRELDEKMLFSIPEELQNEDFIEHAKEIWKYMDGDQGKFTTWFRNQTGIKSFGEGILTIPTHRNALLQMSRATTWWTDRVMRVSTYMSLRGQGYSKAKALIRAREFHGDYDLMRKGLSKYMRRMLLTPAYKVAMWGRLFPELLLHPGRNKMALARVAAVGIAQHALMVARGYALQEWYRYVKPADDDEKEVAGEEKIDVVQMAGPFSEPLKILGRGIEGYKSGGISKAFSRIIFNNLAHVPKIFESLRRNRNWKGDQIVPDGATVPEKTKAIGNFLLRETYSVLSTAEELTAGPDTKGSLSAGQRLLKIAAITAYSRDSNKRKQYESMLSNRMRDLRKWAKEHGEDEPERRQEFQREAARRFASYAVAMNNTLKEYETDLEEMKSPSLWKRLMAGFDEWAFFHTKPKGTDFLLGKQKLKELKAIRSRGRKDPLGTAMRKTFAFEFLKETRRLQKDGR